MKDLVQNKKAYHDYEIIDTFEAGIVLFGTEVKSLKDHSASLVDAYIIEKKGELWLINSSISPFKYGNVHNHKEKRERKILMKKDEILKIKRLIVEKSFALIPLSFYLKDGLIKVKIALAKGKKLYDKRATAKEKEHKMDIKRSLS